MSDNSPHTTVDSATLARAAWRSLRSSQSLRRVSLRMAAVITVANVVLVALIFLVAAATDTKLGSDSTSAITIYASSLAVLGFVYHLVATYFGVAVTHGALQVFDGKPVGASDMLATAGSKRDTIVRYAGMLTVVGTIMSVIEQRVPFGSRVAVWMFGVAWAVANIFSVATIATTDEKNPIKIVKKSGSVFAKVWQQSIFIGLGLGVLQLLIMMVGFVVIISSAIFLMTMDIIAGGAVLAFVAIAIIAWAMVLAGFSSLLQSVVMAAAYYYATTGRTPAGFDEELVRGMFRPRKNWLA